MITLKDLVAAPTRLQRILLTLWQYDDTETIKLDVRIDCHGFTTSRLQQLKAETARTLFFPLLIATHWMDGQSQEEMYLTQLEFSDTKEIY